MCKSKGLQVSTSSHPFMLRGWLLLTLLHTVMPLFLFFQARQTWSLGRQRASSALRSPWVTRAVLCQRLKKTVLSQPIIISLQVKLTESLRMNVISFFFFLLQWWQVEKVNPVKLYEENKVIAGFSLLNLLFKHGKCRLIKSVMNKLLCLYDKKKIKPVVDSLWALEEVRAWGTLSAVLQHLFHRWWVGWIF